VALEGRAQENIEATGELARVSERKANNLRERLSPPIAQFVSTIQ